MGVWVALSCGSAPIGQVYWFRNRLYVTFCLEYPLSYLDSVSSTPHLHRCVVWAWCFNFLTIKVLFPRWASLPLPAADWWGPSSPRFTAGAGLPTRSLWPRHSIWWDTSSEPLKPVSELYGPVSHVASASVQLPELNFVYLRHLDISLVFLSMAQIFIIIITNFL